MIRCFGENWFRPATSPANGSRAGRGVGLPFVRALTPQDPEWPYVLPPVRPRPPLVSAPRSSGVSRRRVEATPNPEVEPSPLPPPGRAPGAGPPADRPLVRRLALRCRARRKVGEPHPRTSGGKISLRPRCIKKETTQRAWFSALDPAGPPFASLACSNGSRRDIWVADAVIYTSQNWRIRGKGSGSK